MHCQMACPLPLPNANFVTLLSRCLKLKRPFFNLFTVIGMKTRKMQIKLLMIC